ncbi:MAG: cytochrome c oxidase subunit 3 [Anaerolineae bacterium]|nr:cytochrome c oxidase subunit 3 [Candidatus Roseilinea sp.]MDW8450203.1 cytochrome c oxidase subunit 3 [Anaerolineae bacterium]
MTREVDPMARATLRDRSMERARRSGDIAPARQKNIGLLGVGFFIVSESMFFLGLFLAWFFMRNTSDAWPPAGVAPPPVVPAVLNTVIALLSTIAVFFADRATARDDRNGLIKGIAVAGALGVIFMAVQAVEFTDLAILAQGSAYGSTFTFLLLFHVLRVFVGVILMGVVLVRTLLGHFSSKRRLLVQATAMYWYFITGVWLVVFAVLYLIG